MVGQAHVGTSPQVDGLEEVADHKFDIGVPGEDVRRVHLAGPFQHARIDSALAHDP